MTDQSVDATDMIPNPGSDAAIALGCTCPILDNGHGRGCDGTGRRFWINAECPIHNRKGRPCLTASVTPEKS